MPTIHQMVYGRKTAQFEPDMEFNSKVFQGANLAPVGHMLRDGIIDGFQARAILAFLSETRFRIFYYRWACMGGKYSDAKAGIHGMLYSASWANIPAAVIGEGC